MRKLATADRPLGEGKDVADVCRELAICEQTDYRWRNQFGGLKADDAKRLKDLEGRALILGVHQTGSTPPLRSRSLTRLGVNAWQ